MHIPGNEANCYAQSPAVVRGPFFAARALIALHARHGDCLAPARQGHCGCLHGEFQGSIRSHCCVNGSQHACLLCFMPCYVAGDTLSRKTSPTLAGQRCAFVSIKSAGPCEMDGEGLRPTLEEHCTAERSLPCTALQHPESDHGSNVGLAQERHRCAFCASTTSSALRRDNSAVLMAQRPHLSAICCPSRDSDRGHEQAVAAGLRVVKTCQWAESKNGSDRCASPERPDECWFWPAFVPPSPVE
ncbi:hypothetical protein FQR65_LT19513 [Abscondita terminalis]|nr:hypothetical protein FQR65_LT19513 [Abscondita terminalis]